MKKRVHSALTLCLTILVLLLVSSRLPADTGTCGGAMITIPFTDIAGNNFFCQIAAAYFSGLTNGTSPTTYSPSDGVTREQMAAFIARTQDSALRRGNRRAVLKQWATPSALPLTGRTPIDFAPAYVASDGADLWVTAIPAGTVTRVRASDGAVLGKWTGATGARAVLVSRGRVFVTGAAIPGGGGAGTLYRIDPSAPPGAVATLSNSLGAEPQGIATDGSFVWTANGLGGISEVDPDTGATVNVTTGFTGLEGMLFDGTNLWVADFSANLLKKLDSSGAVVQSVPVGSAPSYPVFDGSNIWVPNAGSHTVTVVRARDGAVLATLTGNGMHNPSVAAFDGQRVLVTNETAGLSLWKAADLTPIGNFSTGPTAPLAACSDGINFWITVGSQLVRF